MTLQEIIDLGHTSVIAKVSGYQEVGIFVAISLLEL